MELILNELSIATHNDKYVANEAVKDFAKTVSVAKRNGFKNIRSYYATSQINLTDNYTLENWLNDKDFASAKDYKDILYGMIIIPFVKEDDEAIEDAYISATYFYEDTPNGVAKTECVGLASAYLYDTLSISFSSSQAWQKTQLPIIVEKENSTESQIVFNVFSNQSFEELDIKRQIENYGNVSLLETKLKIEDKKRHIAPHHGTKELNELCDQLELNVYVEEMRSTNWGGTKFIRKCNSDGTIEIVLHKTQRKYALLVQTTGRNKRETIEIGKILEDKYS